MDWYSKQQDVEYRASQNLEDTDKAFVLYNQMHPDFILSEPKFSDYYRPSSDKKSGELIFVGGAMLALGYLASRFL